MHITIMYSNTPQSFIKILQVIQEELRTTAYFGQTKSPSPKRSHLIQKLSKIKFLTICTSPLCILTLHKVSLKSKRSYILYSGPSFIRTPLIRTLHLPDNFSWERNYYTLICIINPEIRVPDPDGHFLLQNAKMHCKMQSWVLRRKNVPRYTVIFEKYRGTYHGIPQN